MRAFLVKYGFCNLEMPWRKHGRLAHSPRRAWYGKTIFLPLRLVMSRFYMKKGSIPPFFNLKYDVFVVWNWELSSFVPILDRRYLAIKWVGPLASCSNVWSAGPYRYYRTWWNVSLGFFSCPTSSLMTYSVLSSFKEVCGPFGKCFASLQESWISSNEAFVQLWFGIHNPSPWWSHWVFGE